MGVYDFFKGTCPHCQKQIDDHPDFGLCGDLQDKTFINQPNYDDCFRNFYPGCKIPVYYEYFEKIIGPTCCCGKFIKFIIKDGILQPYQKSKTIKSKN
jgi:hypothetical protein